MKNLKLFTITALIMPCMLLLFACGVHNSGYETVDAENVFNEFAIALNDFKGETGAGSPEKYTLVISIDQGDEDPYCNIIAIDQENENYLNASLIENRIYSAEFVQTVENNKRVYNYFQSTNGGESAKYFTNFDEHSWRTRWQQHKDDYGDLLITVLSMPAPIILPELKENPTDASDIANEGQTKQYNFDSFRTSVLQVVNEEFGEDLNLTFTDENIKYSGKIYKDGRHGLVINATIENEDYNSQLQLEYIVKNGKITNYSLKIDKRFNEHEVNQTFNLTIDRNYNSTYISMLTADLNNYYNPNME